MVFRPGQARPALYMQAVPAAVTVSVLLPVAPLLRSSSALCVTVTVLITVAPLLSLSSALCVLMMLLWCCRLVTAQMALLQHPGIDGQAPPLCTGTGL